MSNKLMSSTEKASVEVNSEKTALIFKSKSCEAGIYWPTKDWETLKRFVDTFIKADA